MNIINRLRPPKLVPIARWLAAATANLYHLKVAYLQALNAPVSAETRDALLIWLKRAGAPGPRGDDIPSVITQLFAEMLRIFFVNMTHDLWAAFVFGWLLIETYGLWKELHVLR
jgi:hypothetical protein